MTQKQSKDEQITRIHELVASFSKVDFAAETKDREFGSSLGFGALIPDLEQLRERVTSLSQLPLNVLPHTTLVDLVRILEGIRDVFAKIDQFNVNEHGAQATHDSMLPQLQNQIWSAEGSLFNQIQPAILEQVRGGDQTQALMEQIQDALHRAKTAATDAEFALGQAQGAERAIREAAAQAGVSVHDEAFKNLADAHEIRSHWALGVCFAFGLALALYLYFAPSPSKGPEPGLNVQDIIHQLAVPVVLVAGLLVSLKVFTAERHNALVNRHRATALSTFKTFVEATQSETIKEAILLQATNCIFSHQSTGYTKAPLEGQSVPLGLLGASGKLGENE